MELHELVKIVLSFQITNFIVFICVIVSELSYTSSAKWANFVAWMGLLITGDFFTKIQKERVLIRPSFNKV